VASLFVVDVSNGALIKEIAVDTSGNNGLSSVKLRVNAQSVVQYAYGGDLKGQMWKFDFTGQTASTWKVGLGGSPLFTASGGANQPITAQPVVGNNPNGGKMVYFGTGKMLEAADKTTTATQAFYAVWDNDGTSANYRESDLVAQAITSSAQFFTTTQNDVNYAAKKGFYLPLIYNNFATGERIIYAAVLAFGRVQFTTAIVDTTDPCSSSGSGRFGDLDALNGKMLSYPVLDTNGDGQINSADANSSGFLVSGGVPSIIRLNKANGNQAIVTGGIANPQTDLELGGPSDRRIMWRQIR
jgi:type IV pilus assembly protein PilY1